MEQFRQDRLSDVDLQVDNDVRRSLTEAGTWTKFISVTVFIICVLFIGLVIAGGSYISGILRTFGRGGFGDVFQGSLGAIIGIAIFAVVLILAVYYFLFNFSLKIKRGLMNEDAAEFNAGLNSLKIYFIITTILSLLTLLISIVNMIKL